MLKKAIKIVKRIAGWLERCRIRVYAAQASFFVMISSLPFLILLLTILGALLPQIGENVKAELLKIVPSSYEGTVSDILNEVEGKSNAGIMSISAVTMLWAAIRGIHSIGDGIRNVISGDRRIGAIAMWVRSLGFMIVYIFSIIATLAMLVFGDVLRNLIGYDDVGTFEKLTNSMSVFVVLTLVFALTYLGYAGKKLKFYTCLPGAALSSMGWLVFSGLFEYYVENFANYSYIYGSLASVIVIMLWFYTCSEMLLIGAGVTAWFADNKPAVMKVEICRKG